MSRRRANKTRPFVQFDAKLMKYYMPLIGPNGLAVYTCLKLHENRRTGQCNPSYQTIADETRLSRRSAIRYTALLISLKLISPIAIWSSRGNRTSNQYHLTDPARLDYGQTGGPGAPKTGGDIPAPPPALPEPPSHYGGDSLAPQPDPLNQIYRTKENTAQKTTPSKQQICPHPAHSVRHLDTDINICNHCFGLLDDHGVLVEPVATLREEENADAA
jgi:hypothetical protein